MSVTSAFHLGLNSLDIKSAILAIIPGNPQRVSKIASMMSNPSHLSTRREFVVWRAEINENIIIVCSTGIGGPSTSIVVEELAQLGIRIFLRVGTTGAIQEYINVGDLLIINAAVRLDGASQHFAPLEFPAVSNFDCTTSLVKAAKHVGVRFHLGFSVSSDTFYPGQERYNTYTGYVITKLRGSMQEWQNMGVMSYEMESATLLTMCAVQGLKAGVITGVIVNRLKNEIPNNKTIRKIEKSTANVVIKAAQILLTSSFC
ncbi:uridine phosphorylase [Blochmannia endosymbiont of Colobopsis nipponica]|uniref:uridine phosphorylase n=1 Tax=Blochmannia endosymbiont of Colobopsis nipponica TaxID=2681987 RepID=UPI001783C303|nr:uridine phosphorylase [Blochmannia endosymbiont of Colobopsis nipponica]QOI10849.1 uridine phosphorylase [Blochmannia endosymbiont of Colobopsis nipponica]